MFGEDADYWHLVFRETPFYGESGGQVGDTGVVEADGQQYIVSDTLKSNDRIIHLIKKSGRSPEQAKQFKLIVNPQKRIATACNHTATHLLQASLRKVLGEHLHQSGSWVSPERLRFDFTHFEKISEAQLKQVETLVNEMVGQGVPVVTQELNYREAVAAGATALFGEKYGDRVRMVKVSDFSNELCGGTHITNTAQIRVFRIIAEGSVATGIRRIEAVTGIEALKLYNQERSILVEASQILKADPNQLLPKLTSLIQEYGKLQKDLAKVSQTQAADQTKALYQQIKTVGNSKYIVARVDGLNMEQLRESVDKLRDEMGSGVAALGSLTDGKLSFVVGVTKELTAKIQAGSLIKAIAAETGGSGGGRPDLAQAGGKEPGKLDQALQTGEKMIISLLS